MKTTGMIGMKGIYLYLMLFLAGLVSSCAEEGAPEPAGGEGLTVKVYGMDFEGEGAKSRTAGVELDLLKFYFVREGRIVSGMNVQAGTSTIKAEGLVPGDYRLLLLGVKGDPAQDGAVIHDIQSPEQVWLEFDEEGAARPLTADYFFADYPFTAVQGQAVALNVGLKHLGGQLVFEPNYKTQYVKASAEQVEVALPDFHCYTQFTGEGAGMKPAAIPVQPVRVPLEGNSVCFLPVAEQEPVKGKVEFITRNHLGERGLKSLEFTQVPVKGNVSNRVKLNLTSEDAEQGMVFASRQTLTEENYYMILSDTEKKEVFYDAAQRSFYVNEPIQADINAEGVLHLRYYCPKPMKGVSVYGRFEGTEGKFVQLAYVEELPGFADVVYPMEAFGEKRVFRTREGGFLKLQLPENIGSAVEFKFYSSDGLMAMFDRIPSRWLVSFSAYGANPDLENGGQKDKWIGIRPVHIRSAIGVLQNLAYMLTFQELHDQVRYWDGPPLKDDHNVPIEGDDRYEILQKMVRLNRLVLGLVHDVQGSVRGLGGGTVLAVDQEGWTQCFHEYGITRRNLPVILHEFGHCMGYMQHHGCMTDYGPESYVSQQIMPRFYYKLYTGGLLPVDKDYVDASSNPYLYRFK